MSAKALHCPNCGASIESDRSQCQFCKSRLKTVGCPSCFDLMFLGSKFCESCGAVAKPVSFDPEKTSGDCPRCKTEMETLVVEQTTLAGCTKCDGLWMAADAFETVCLDSERQSAVLGFLSDRRKEPQQLTKVNYVPCPDCGQLMNRNNFAKASGVIVDICKQHGVWFDSDELPAIIEFIRKGGMEISRQRERNEIEQERNRLREERWKSDLGPRSSRLGKIIEDEVSSDTRSFVRRLFNV